MAGEPPKKKLKGNTQMFKPSYTEEWPCIIKSRVSVHHAFCTVCSTDFSIKHSGRFDCKTHISGAKHNSLLKSRRSTNIASMFKSMSSSSASTDIDSSILKAEVLMADFIAQNNLSLSVADQLPSLIKKMCPDSTVAKGIRCGRSKTTAMINEMALCTQEVLIQKMKAGPFTISTDGSNDMGKTKLFPLVVRTISSDGIHSELLSVPTCSGSATGEKIFSLINNFFSETKIPWTNCLALGSDNANVMTGKTKGLLAFCTAEHPDILLAGCPLHLVHLAAEKGASVLPVSPNDIFVDVYFYFAKSSLRAHRLAEFQEFCGADQLQMLKHGSTRWLSVGRCLTRLLNNWEPLKLFFKEECKRTDLSGHAKKKSSKILEVLSSRSTRLYLMFLQYTIQPFETFLTLHQSDAPKISSIITDCKHLIRSLMSRFVQPTAFGGNKSVQDVEFKLPYNIKANKDLLIGEDCLKFIANKDKNGLSDSKLADFYSHVKQFFFTAIDYLLKSLPLNDPVLAKLSVTDPALLPSSSLNNIRFLVNKYPVFIPAGTSVDTILKQFVNLQCSIPGDLEFTRVDEFWAKVGQLIEGASKPYGAIAFFMLGLLTIPHSSAHCERVFSCVRKIKTDQRSSMAPKTLESLLVLKHRLASSFAFNAGELTPETMKRLKGAYTASLSK